MSQLTLVELIEEMQGKSLTCGWDAVTLYDQRKANELLMQLYIERFNTSDGYIKPISTVAPWGDGVIKDHLFNLKLSAPRLSFESSSPEIDPRARLTLDMIGGLIIRTEKPSGGPHFVTQISEILPIGGPQLWMDQPITKGDVSGLGEVIIDIAKADNFKANFVVGSLAQSEVGQHFQNYFSKLPPGQKKFSLGSIDGIANDVLTPRNFEIKVVKSNPVSVLGDLDYGDGAVMLFITLENGEDGKNFPASGSLYLLPVDECGLKFTGGMLLSSRVLFDKIIRAPAIVDIGHGIEFLDYTTDNGGGSDIGWSLKAKEGGVNYQFVHDYQIRSDDFDARFETNLTLNFEADDGGPALTIRGAGNRIEFVLDKHYTRPFSRVIHYAWPTCDKWAYGGASFDIKYTVSFDVVLDNATGQVSFKKNENSSDFQLKIGGFEHLEDLVWEGINMIALADDFYRPQLEGILQSLTTPTLETFILRNLLFPGHNALQLTEAFVPGDLAVFGQIDPLRTSTVLSPLNSCIEAGSLLQFFLTPKAENVNWQVRDVDGVNAPAGSISASGLYSAPTQAEMPDGFVAVIVTAEGTLNNQPVKSSALVTVVNSMITVTASYTNCDAGQTKELSAKSLNGAILEWTHLTPEWGSTLSEVPGKPDLRHYSAGCPPDPDTAFFLDKFEVKQNVNGVVTIAYIQVLILKQGVSTPMWITEDSEPSSGTVQFELRGKNGPIDPTNVIWKLISGEGTFDDLNGIYTEPSTILPSSFIVVSGTVPGDFADIHAYAVVPLPLSKYVEIIEYSDTPVVLAE